MAFLRRVTSLRGRGFLARLRSDKSGNVFAMTAAAIIPMIGVVGGAVDASRLYLTRSRLQAACDAGVLAGRKAMTTTQYTTTADTRAKSMFNFNFQDRDFGTNGTNFAPAGDANGKVNATAVTTVPMTMMRALGVTSKSMSVSCSADIQIPNIDVVFVLDVTGSMAQSLGSTTKIAAMREATRSFYTTLANQLASNGTNAGQVRYGFVPYDQTVRVTDLFRSSPNTDRGEASLNNLADSMTVQSRVANFNTSSGSGGSSGEWVVDTSASPTTFDQQYRGNDSDSTKPFTSVNGGNYKISNLDCAQYSANQSFNILSTDVDVTMYPRTTFPGQGIGDSVLYIPEGAPANTAQVAEPTTGTTYTKITFSRQSGTWEDNNGATTGNYQKCKRTVRRTKYKRDTTGFRFTNWTYKPITVNVSSYKAGGTLQYVSGVNTNYSVATQGSYDPIQLRAMTYQSGLSSSSSTWNGCIEERDSVAVSSFSPIPANAFDLNWLLAGTTDATKWRPVLRDMTYDRSQVANKTTTSNYSSPDTSCPEASVRNLNTMTQVEFDDYVATLEPGGNTYLDVGMIWGLRLIAPQGMFGSRNLTGPNGGQISRHIIFLTDGDPVSRGDTYSAYGVEDMAKRITGSTGDSAATLHARRFKALCDGMRGSVSIWAIALDTSVASNLSACADTGRAFQADNATQLNAAFANIARQVADLRLVQ